MVSVEGALGLKAEADDDPPDRKWPRMLSDQPSLAEPRAAATTTNSWLTRRFSRRSDRTTAADEAQTAFLQKPFSGPGTTAAYARLLPRLLFADRQATSVEPGNYAKIDMPLALLWGRKDAVSPPPEGERLQRLVPGATLDVFAGVRHTPL